VATAFFSAAFAAATFFGATTCFAMVFAFSAGTFLPFAGAAFAAGFLTVVFLSAAVIAMGWARDAAVVVLSVLTCETPC
jgi:hypothetical protein